MRRWVIPPAVLTAIAGLAIAVALPDGSIRNCPTPGFGVTAAPCVDTPDPRALLRFVIAATAALPAIVLLALRFAGDRRFRFAFVVVGVGVAVGLWSIGGLVPNPMADCPPYQRCYSLGHPYAGPAALVLLMTLIGRVALALALAIE